MGQYGNQPDFGTIVTSADIVGLDKEFPPSAIYIGQTEGNGPCTITVLPVGNAPEDDIIISGIQPGTFLPIVVIKIIDKSAIESVNILLYR